MMCLLYATKNLKIFSECSIVSLVYPKILVCGHDLHYGIYVRSYLGNGTFLSFWNSAGVLVQPWIWIFMSKFEVLLECWKQYNTLGLSWIYVYFEKKTFFLLTTGTFKNFKIFEKNVFFEIAAGFATGFCSFFQYHRNAKIFDVPYVRKS